MERLFISREGVRGPKIIDKLRWNRRNNKYEKISKKSTYEIKRVQFGRRQFRRDIIHGPRPVNHFVGRVTIRAS